MILVLGAPKRAPIFGNPLLAVIEGLAPQTLREAFLLLKPGLDQQRLEAGHTSKRDVPAASLPQSYQASVDDMNPHLVHTRLALFLRFWYVWSCRIHLPSRPWRFIRHLRQHGRQLIVEVLLHALLGNARGPWGISVGKPPKPEEDGDGV